MDGIVSPMEMPMPIPSRQAAPRRPKLALRTGFQGATSNQTASPSALAPLTIDLSKVKNTHEITTKRESSASSPRSSSLHHSSKGTFRPQSPPRIEAKSNVSVVSTEIPYRLSHGTSSILKNGPIPSQSALRSPLRRSRWKDPLRVKRVLFRDTLIELMPTPLIGASDSEEDPESISTEPKEQKGPGEESEGQSVPSNVPPLSPHRKRKKRRDWVWTIEKEDEDSPVASSRPYANEDLKNGLGEKIRYPKTPIPSQDGRGSSSESASETE